MSEATLGDGDGTPIPEEIQCLDFIADQYKRVVKKAQGLAAEGAGAPPAGPQDATAEVAVADCIQRIMEECGCRAPTRLYARAEVSNRALQIEKPCEYEESLEAGEAYRAAQEAELQFLQ